MTPPGTGNYVSAKFRVNSAIRTKLWPILRRPETWDWLLTLLAIYIIHHLFVTYFVAPTVKDIVTPFPHIPAYLYTGWDGVLYRNLYNSYDRFNWPPLYPFALRAVSFVCQFKGPTSFDKSALLLNLLSHAVIVAGLARYIKQDGRLAGAAPWFAAFALFLYPFHNVFFAAYSESFYLALTIVAFLFHQKQRIGLASLTAGLSSLVRMMGSFLAVAFVAEQVFYCIRDRKIHWRNLLFASLGLMIVIAWHATLKLLGTDAVASNTDWISDLLTNHVPQGANAKLWVFKYLAFSPRLLEVIAFWSSMLAIAYCGWRRRYLAMFYIAAFNFSLCVYLYRPFAWTRYVSVLFPIQIMLADVLRNKPRLMAAVLIASAGTSYMVQRKLFQGLMGEP
jgi:hypothetical protein